MLDKTKNYKIDVSSLNAGEMTKLQERLFKQGYKWCDGEREVSELDADVLFLSPDMDISYGNKKDFNRYDYTTLTVSDIMPETIELPTITLRDWFAGQALAGLFSNPGVTTDFNFIVEASFVIADLMLKERNK